MKRKLNEDLDEQFINPFKEECEVFQATSCIHTFDIPLDTAIREPSYYRKAFQTFKYAGPDDLIRLDIQNSGGQLDTAIMFRNAIQDTAATVLGVLEGDAHSAASFIALSCHGLQVKPYASMMIHHASFGSIGTMQNVVDHVTFTSKRTEKLVREVYRHFLTPEEIEEVIHNREIWLTDSEIEERLDIMFEKRQQEMEESIAPPVKPKARKKSPKI